MNQDLYQGQVSGKYRKSGRDFQQQNIRKFLHRLFRIMHVRGTDQIWRRAGGRVTDYVPFLHLYNPLFISFVTLIRLSYPKSFHKNIQYYEQAHPFGGRSAASSGPRWARMLFERVNFTRGSRGPHPLGCLPLWGREGVTLINRKNLRRLIGFYPAATE